MVEGAKRAFSKFYGKLIELLPMNDLLEDLRANKLLPGIHKAKIKSLSTQKEKARYLLDEVIKPGLSVGYIEPFNKMVTVMESSDRSMVKRLAKQIRTCSLDVSPNSSSSDDNGMRSVFHSVPYKQYHMCLYYNISGNLFHL